VRQHFEQREDVELSVKPNDIVFVVNKMDILMIVISIQTAHGALMY